ncbi:MAG TPA: S9 family peptidase [Caulobacteraceae bacterium]|jgi:dipeptidyl aminopeptidase/acylaminoacyl peptidase|nr:S9 family peptidase [Caulobacteraceae bacterium]
MPPCLRALAFWLAAAPSLALCAVTEGVPPRPLTDPHAITSVTLQGAGPVPIPDLFYLRSAMGGAWTPDGKSVVISTNLTGRFNLWRVDLAGGFPLQLAQSDERQNGIAISPRGDLAVFQSDRAGDEIWDLFAAPLAGGPTVRLTDTPDVSETGALFSADGRSLAFGHRLKSAAQTNIAIMDLATRKVRVLTHETGPFEWSPAAFTGAGRSILATRLDFNQRSAAVWLVDVGGAPPRRLTEEDGFNRASDITRDGRYAALTTQLSDGRRQAAILNLATGALRLVQDEPWEQASGHFSPDGRVLVFERNHDGRRELAAFDLASGDVHRLGRAPGVDAEAAATASSISPDGTRLLFVHQSSATPVDYWVDDLRSGEAAPVTRLGLASVDAARLPPAQVVHYPSFDGTVISALLWMPFNLPRDAKAPAVVLPHGGPTGQTVDSFDRTALALASRGYVVIAPNPRGSTGYGRAFQDANIRDLGGGDLKDEVAGVQFLIATGYVDRARVGITGGSYGGYMTLMAAAKTPELWRAAVEMFGIIDWFHMYETEAPTLQQYQRGLMGDPVADKAVYEADSPLTWIHHLAAPLLVLQGDNDIRVPRTQALQIVDLLKADHRTVDVHFYPNEGHGFVKRENQIDSLERTIAWFDRYLKAQ